MAACALLLLCVLLSPADGQLEPVSSPVPRNWIVGTQEIYGPGQYLYNFTTDPMLVEQTDEAVELGATQMKIVLSSDKTCLSYGLDCDPEIVHDLASLSATKGLAKLFADPRIHWYHFWLESFSNPHWPKHDWTNESLAAEFEETKAWALHMLVTYNNTGAVFMVGNWEGDWTLLTASGCRESHVPGRSRRGLRGDRVAPGDTAAAGGGEKGSVASDGFLAPAPPSCRGGLVVPALPAARPKLSCPPACAACSGRLWSE